MKEEPPDHLNFCRVFELPTTYPEGFLFGGGKPVTMNMVDWFQPWPRDGKDATWAEVKERLVAFVKQKDYVKPGRRYVILTEFGESVMFGEGLPIGRRVFEQYKHLTDIMLQIRKKHNGEDSQEEDTLLDFMDGVWWDLTDEERAQLNNHRPEADDEADVP